MATAASLDEADLTKFIKLALVRALRRAAVGWLLNSGLSGFSALLRYSRKDGTLYDVLQHMLRNKTSVYLGSFMAVFGILFQLSRRAVNDITVSRGLLMSSPAQYALSGGVAGLSILALAPCVGTHLDPYALSLHSLVRAIQAAARQHGSLRLSNHAGSLLFVACCTLLMYSWFYHPEALGRDCAL